LILSGHLISLDRTPQSSSQVNILPRIFSNSKGVRMSHVMNLPDPNFPLIQLPAQFRARRQTLRDRQVAVGETKEVFRARGPGCVRHIWISPNPTDRPRTTDDVKDNSDVNSVIKIYVDDDPRPLVNMDLKRLCGVHPSR
jgi:hypothetical protein